MFGCFLLRCTGVILHSLHLVSLGVISLQGPSCINGAIVRFSVDTVIFTKGLLKEEPEKLNNYIDENIMLKANKIGEEEKKRLTPEFSNVIHVIQLKTGENIYIYIYIKTSKKVTLPTPFTTSALILQCPCFDVLRKLC